MDTDVAPITTPAPDGGYPLWKHVSSVAENPGAPFDKVADGLSAAFLTVMDPNTTHDLVDAFVSSVEAVLSDVAGRTLRLPDSTACELNAVLQVGIEEMLDQ